MKWLWRVLAVLVLGVLGVGLWVYLSTEQRLQQRLSLTPTAPELPHDPEALAEGARIAQLRGCLDCHGADLGGKVFLDGPPGQISSANLTSGRGGVGARYTPVDWARAIRHGVAPEGRLLWIMPADDNTAMSQADLGRLIAYLRQVPAVDREPAAPQLSVLGRVLFAIGALPLLPAERIDHATVPAPDVLEDGALGPYLAQVCRGCHGAQLRGGPIPGMPPDFPPAADLTGGSRSAGYSRAQFAAVMREGKLPDGRQLNPQHMPWTAFAAMTDRELQALSDYLRTLP